MTRSSSNTAGITTSYGGGVEIDFASGYSLLGGKSLTGRKGKESQSPADKVDETPVLVL